MGELEHAQGRLCLRRQRAIDGARVIALGVQRRLDPHDEQLERIGAPALCNRLGLGVRLQRQIVGRGRCSSRRRLETLAMLPCRTAFAACAAL